MFSSMFLDVKGHVRITDADTGEILLDKNNAIHPQNMSRIIARALAREPNYYIHRIAFGNGGTITDPTGKIVFNPTNDGRDGSWQSRLYNETYSEIVDDISVNFGYDPGSAEPGNIRTGGGSVQDDDPEGGGVRSQEVGSRSNVVISMFINKNEPTGQINSINDFGIDINDRERTFIFDEIGLYSSGKQASNTYGFSSIFVGNKTSVDVCQLVSNTTYNMSYTINGVHYSTTITTPSGGSGPSGQFTYGDLCQGLNSGDWIVSGKNFSDVAFIYITDRTSGDAYPSIHNKESYGLLTVQSNISGAESSVNLDCDTSSGNDLFAALTNNICDNVNYNKVDGESAGVVNDAVNPENERERLLTHIIFPPIAKTADKALNIVYTLTITVARTTDSRVNQITT